MISLSPINMSNLSFCFINEQSIYSQNIFTHEIRNKICIGYLSIKVRWCYTDCFLAESFSWIWIWRVYLAQFMAEPGRAVQWTGHNMRWKQLLITVLLKTNLDFSITNSLNEHQNWASRPYLPIVWHQAHPIWLIQ